MENPSVPFHSTLYEPVRYPLPRHSQFRQAPLRGGVGLTADHDHRRAQLQVPIELIPPALAGLNASVGVEVEKQRAEALLLGPLLLLIFQPITDPLGPGVVVAAVADEDGAHDAGAEAASGQITWASLAWPLMGYRGSGDLPNAQDQKRTETLELAVTSAPVF